LEIIVQSNYIYRHVNLGLGESLLIAQIKICLYT
jgi:hypothetical protein